MYSDVKTEELPPRHTRSSSRSGPRAGSCERRYSETPAHDSCSGSGRTADTASQEQCARKARTRAFENGECAGSGAAGHLAAGGLIKVITFRDNLDTSCPAAAVPLRPLHQLQPAAQPAGGPQAPD